MAFITSEKDLFLKPTRTIWTIFLFSEHEDNIWLARNWKSRTMSKALGEQKPKRQRRRRELLKQHNCNSPQICLYPVLCLLFGGWGRKPQLATNSKTPAERHRLTFTNELSSKVTPEVNHVNIIKSNNRNAFILPSAVELTATYSSHSG